MPKQSHRLIFAVAVLFGGSSCKKNEVLPSQEDAGTTDTIILDASSSMTTDAGTFIPKGEALLIDFDMGPHTRWATVIQGLQTNEYALKYRRWFPHIVDEDIDGPYATIIVAGGSGPGYPTELMRPDDATRLVSYVEAGGTLVLMPRNTWQDSMVGTNDWYFFNRILELLDLPTRIEQNTAIGDVSIAQGSKPPLHIDSAWAYSGPLEWTINLAIGYPADTITQTDASLGAFAMGYVPTLMCNGDNVTPLARTHNDVIVWWQQEGASDSRIAFPGTAQAVSVMAQTSSGGAVFVLPRAMAELPSHSSQGADQPVLNLSYLDQTQAVTEAIIDLVIKSIENPQSIVATGCMEGNLDLFSPAIRIRHSDLEVPAQIPKPGDWAPDLYEAPSKQTPTTTTPNWFKNGRARMAYGDLKPKAELRGMLSQAKNAGIDAYVIRVESEHLIDYDPSTPTHPFSVALEVVQELGGHLYLGAHFLNPQLMNRLAETGPSLGAHGQQLNAPPPLHDVVWDEILRPLILGAANAAKDHSVVKGVLIDTELYNAGAPTYFDGQAFDENTWLHVTRALDAKNFELGTEALLVRRTERLSWLVDRGLVGFAYKTLEDAVADRAAALRIEARSIAPQLELAIYIPFARTSWFYRGLMRGWGTAAKPLLVLTYDTVTVQTRKALNREGVHVRMLGGLLGVLFDPQNFENGLVNSGLRSDGYWLFQYGDFPDTEDAAFIETKHAAPREYWSAVTRANMRLDQSPPPD